MARSTEYVMATLANRINRGGIGRYEVGKRYRLWLDRVDTGKGTEIHILAEPTHQISLLYPNLATFEYDWVDIEPVE